jgi:hypothetical protein
MAVRLDYPEGATPLDPNELGGLKHRHVTTQGKLDELEQANIASGLRWLAGAEISSPTISRSSFTAASSVRSGVGPAASGRQARTSASIQLTSASNCAP